MPVWCVVLIEWAPLVVQPVKSPVSKPPLTIALGGGMLTARATLALWLRLPLVPVMTTVNGPVAATLVVVAVRVDVPLPETDAGLNDPETPAPKPVAERRTESANPFVPVSVPV